LFCEARKNKAAGIIVRRHPPPNSKKHHPRASTSSQLVDDDEEKKEVPAVQPQPETSVQSDEPETPQPDEIEQIRELLRPASIPGIEDWGIPPPSTKPIDPVIEVNFETPSKTNA
jgi:hypothetical protein